MPATASSRTGSARKKFPMSFAIRTRCSAPPCSSLLMAYLLGDEHIGVDQRFLRVRELTEAFLPLGRLADARRLYGGDLVLRAIRRPVRVVGSDHVCAGLREMEGRIDHAWLYPLGDLRAQHSIARPARDSDPVSLFNSALLGVVRMNLQAVLIVPAVILGATRLRADVVLAQYAPSRQYQRVSGIDLLVGRHIFRHQELALAAHELTHVHGRSAFGVVDVARPLDAAELIEPRETHPREGRSQTRDLIH